MTPDDVRADARLEADMLDPETWTQAMCDMTDPSKSADERKAAILRLTADTNARRKHALARIEAEAALRARVAELEAAVTEWQRAGRNVQVTSLSGMSDGVDVGAYREAAARLRLAAGGAP